MLSRAKGELLSLARASHTHLRLTPLSRLLHPPPSPAPPSRLVARPFSPAAVEREPSPEALDGSSPERLCTGFKSCSGFHHQQILGDFSTD